MKALRFATYALIFMLCNTTSIVAEEFAGIWPNGTKEFPLNPITVERAVDLARPYLDESFKLGKVSLNHRPRYFSKNLN